MYNMDISILGYKFNLEVLILIGVVYLILVGHMFCGCCNFGLMEGMTTPTVTPNANQQQRIDTRQQNRQDDKANAQTMKTNLQTMKTNLQTQVAAGGPTTTTPTTSTTTTEGFTGANINYGLSSPYDLSSDMKINTSTWSAQDMTVVPGQQLSSGVKQFLAREPQPVPLPEGEMLLFANTQFKP